jgi:dihydroorotate dehydrogenase
VGNPRPRLFRLSADRAVINRMGFNNVGLEAAIAQVADHGPLPGPLGVNLASNSDSADPAQDFETLVRGLAPHVDYLVVDVSCPNTANGKVFQNPDKLAPLLDRLMQARGEAAAKALPQIWLKIAPDLTETELAEICAVAVSGQAQGMIVSNTTIERPAGLLSPEKGERGGLSGAPLFGPATERLASVRRLTNGRMPLIGVGGIFTGQDAYAKIRAGASGLQLYTAMVYEGPAVVTRIKRSLADLLRRDGYASVDSAVGADVPIETAPLLRTA